MTIMWRFILAPLIFFSWYVPEIAATPYKDRTLTIGFLSKENVSFDIATVDSYFTVFVLKQISQTLVDNDLNGKIIPSVAEFWTVSRDQRRYTFTLRKNLTFADGSQLTSEDVEYSLRLIQNSENNPLSQCLKKIKNIRSISKYSIEIELKSPRFGVLDCLSSGLAPIFSKKLYDLEKRFLGSGPYFLEQQDDNWYLTRNLTYRGHYSPSVEKFRVLLKDKKVRIDPDILISGLPSVESQKNYKKTEVDSFISYSFMINPAREHYRKKEQRLMLMKALMETKDVIKTEKLKDLKDIFPKGMLGFDIENRGFDKFIENSANSNPSKLEKKAIVIGSLGPVINFATLAERLKEKYGILAVNEIVEAPGYLGKLAKNKNIDVFAVGWASIFSHPDAVFTPYIALGLEKIDGNLGFLIGELQKKSNQSEQYKAYRAISYLLISEGYIFPHSQISTIVYTKSSIDSPVFRYRYTVQLSELRIGEQVEY